MTSDGEPEAPSPVTPQRATEHGERWWPVALAVIVVAGLHVALPVKYRVDPAWVVPAVLLALLAALAVAHSLQYTSRDGDSPRTQLVAERAGPRPVP